MYQRLKDRREKAFAELYYAKEQLNLDLGLIKRKERQLELVKKEIKRYNEVQNSRSNHK